MDGEEVNTEKELLAQFPDGDHLTLMELSRIDTLDVGSDLEQAVQFLRSVSPDGRPVSVKDVQLERIGRQWPRLVPMVWTLRRSAPGQYTYGVVGQSLVEAGGFAKRGTMLSDVPGSEVITRTLDYMCESRKVLYRIGVPTLQHRIDVLRLEVFMIPVVDNADSVVSFLNFTRYFWSSGRRSGFTSSL